MIQVPDGWEIKSLNDVTSKISDGIHTTPNYTDNSNFYFINGNNLENGEIVITDSTRCVEEEEYINHKITLNENTILLSINGTIGNIAFYKNEKVILGKSAAYLICKNSINTNFLAFLLSSVQIKQSFELNLTGSTIKNLSIRAIKDTIIPFPSKKEQEKIAKILSTLDNAIESTNRIIEKEKNIKTALMQELLTNGIDKNGQIRTPQTHAYKQTELGLVPDEWEVKALKSVGSCKNGLTYSPDDIIESDGVLVLRSSNIKNNKLTFSDNVFVREDMKVNYKVQENDILICVRNGSKNLIGKNALITRESINMAHGAFMTVFHSNINEYVFQLFQSDLFFKQVEKNLGATINSINNSDLLLFDFSFPKDEIEQKQITKILTTQDEKIEIEEKNLAKLKELKKGLMNDLLSGNVRVNV